MPQRSEKEIVSIKEKGDNSRKGNGEMPQEKGRRSAQVKREREQKRKDELQPNGKGGEHR